MNYLFGDSTPSELTSNFLEFFRDALDFSVFALLANERINDGKERIEALRAEAGVEIDRLNRFITTVTTNVGAAEKAAGGAADSPTSLCATNIGESIAHAKGATVDSIRQKLAAEIAQIEAEENATREATETALATLLRPHDPPDARATMHVTIEGSGSYDSRREVHAGFGLDWIFDLAIPDGHIWSAPLRVERIVPQLEIRAPQLSGFFSKEVKIRPQKIARYVVTDFSDDGSMVTIRMRAELGTEAGFDFTVEDEWVKGTRVGEADDASVGPFDIHTDDTPKLIELAEKLRATAPELEQKQLRSATVGEAKFAALPSFVTFVESFVAMMTPIVREISERSLTANELVIRRALSNDRREEIFVSKKTLREKYAELDARLRAVFAPLGLDAPTPSQRPPNAKTTSEKPPVRAELPKSLPPPAAIPSPPPPPSSAMKTMPKARISSSDLKTLPVSTITSPTAVSSPAMSAPPTAPSSPAALASLSSAARPATSSAPEIKMTDDPSRNQVLVAALKKIALLSRNGRTDEAYREYATLFSSAAFSDYRPDDQRAALRLMVLAKSPPPTSDIVREAHRAALGRIDALVKSSSEPADYELLGIAHVVLEDATAAGEAFSKALSIERAKNPQSELCGNLMKRVAAL
ncbi:MAG: hypothetical protein ABI183_18950 [Polyangiaceae bacterium]